MTIIERPRRLRSSAAIRNLIRENRLDAASLVLPLFVKEGLTEPVAIPGMPGVVQHSQESLKFAIDEALNSGISGVMLFGIPQHRDPVGSEALNPNGILSTAVHQTRAQVGNDLVVIADLCLDEFTSHGHCGVLDSVGRVDNDGTLVIYAEMAGVLAQSGAHMLGTSGMMDGQVGAARSKLDQTGFQDVMVLAYAAKYASAFYGPFRHAVDSQLQGDRLTYQQDPGNSKEALRETRLDVAEGADIVMVKPALAYLDILHAISNEFDVPSAAYVVSGEMAMIEAAAAQGAIDRERAILEVLSSVHRAGASVICTYWAVEVAKLLR